MRLGTNVGGLVCSLVYWLVLWCCLWCMCGGSGATDLIFFVNSWASLYAEAPLQLTTGRIGWSGLCSVIRPLIEGANGFRFMCFHFSSEGMSISLLFITFLKLYTNVLVKDTLEKNGVEPQIRQELLNWYDTITNQNYFSNNGKILFQ